MKATLPIFLEFTYLFGGNKLDLFKYYPSYF